MRKLLAKLNPATWRRARQTRGAREERWRDIERRWLWEEETILRTFLWDRDVTLDPRERRNALSELRVAIRAGRLKLEAEPRTKDIVVTFNVPLPRVYWRQRQHSKKAKANMSAAQLTRWGDIHEEGKGCQ